MRKHKFRGISEEDGTWQYGDLIHADVLAGGKIGLIGIRKQGYYPVEVLPETVGEYTGRNSYDDVEIYEADTVKSGMTGAIYDVYYSVEFCQWLKRRVNCDGKDVPLVADDSATRIIGNIHEEAKDE